MSFQFASSKLPLRIRTSGKRRNPRPFYTLTQQILEKISESGYIRCSPGRFLHFPASSIVIGSRAGDNFESRRGLIYRYLTRFHKPVFFSPFSTRSFIQSWYFFSVVTSFLKPFKRLCCKPLPSDQARRSSLQPPFLPSFLSLFHCFKSTIQFN